MRELRRSSDRSFLGVAAGFAEYFEMDKTIWRAIWILACFMMPPLFLVYVILGFVLPPPLPGGAVPGGGGYEAPDPGPQPGYGAPGAGPQPRPVRRLTKSRDRWLAGVAGGLAEYLDLDPVVVRFLFLAAFFVFGTGIMLYLILAILMPGPDYHYPPR